MECIGIWALDLESVTPAWAGYERYAQAIIRHTVKSICALPETEFEVRVRSQEFWLEAVSASAKGFLGEKHQI